MAESEQDRNPLPESPPSGPTLDKPEIASDTPPDTKAKPSKWKDAQEVVGGDERDDDKENEQGDEGLVLKEDAGPAGLAADSGRQGDYQVPARAANDPMAGSIEAKPSDPVPVPMKDTREHPTFAVRHDMDRNRPAFGGGSEESRSRNDELDRREEDLRKREAEVQRREDAAKPQAATVSDRDVDSQIIGENYIRGIDAFKDAPNLTDADKVALGSLTIGVLSLRNGGVVVGTSESDSPDNYDPNRGRDGARADARSQLDAMHRYAHRMKVAGI